MAVKKTTQAPALEPVKKAEAVKEAAGKKTEAVEKAAAKAAETKKIAAAEKTTVVKKPAAAKKTTAAKKTAAAKKVTKPEVKVTFEFADQQIVAKELADRAAAAFAKAHQDVAVKTMEIYVNAQDSCAYLVVNGEEYPEDKINL